MDWGLPTQTQVTGHRGTGWSMVIKLALEGQLVDKTHSCQMPGGFWVKDHLTFILYSFFCFFFVPSRRVSGLEWWLQSRKGVWWTGCTYGVFPSARLWKKLFSLEDLIRTVFQTLAPSHIGTQCVKHQHCLSTTCNACPQANRTLDTGISLVVTRLRFSCAQRNRIS